MWIANYSVTPLQSTQNRTHTPLHGPGLSGPTGGQHLSRFLPAAQAHPPARLREPRTSGLLDGSAPLSPHCRSPDTPRPLHTRQQPAAGLLAASACPSTGRHCPAWGRRWALPPPRVQGPLSPHLRCRERLGTYSSIRGAAPSSELQGDFVNLHTRTCDLWHAGRCTWDTWICLWGLISDPPRSKPASPVTPETGPATQRRLL